MIRLFAILFVLVSCSSVSSYKIAKSNFSETRTDDIEVYSLEEIGRPYMPIGIVAASADSGEDSKRPINLIKEEAAEMGADAIVGLTLRLSYGFWRSATEASGIAVKYIR